MSHLEGINILQRAYFCLSKPIGAETKAVVTALHGYAQRADTFMNKLMPYIPENICLVVPQGPSLFYISDINLGVGSSWFTKQHFEDQTRMNNLYLELILNTILPPNLKPELILYGFSQGAVQAFSFLGHTGFEFSHFIANSGLFPSGIRFPYFSKVPRNMEIQITYGDCEPHADMLKLNEQIKAFENSSCRVTLNKFLGGHQINTSLFSEIMEKISAKFE